MSQGASFASRDVVAAASTQEKEKQEWKSEVSLLHHKHVSHNYS